MLFLSYTPAVAVEGCLILFLGVGKRSIWLYMQSILESKTDFGEALMQANSAQEHKIFSKYAAEFVYPRAVPAFCSRST